MVGTTILNYINKRAIRSCSLEKILSSILVIFRFPLFSNCSIEKLGVASKTFRRVIVVYCP